MTYSAARWANPEGRKQSLEEAQIAKLDWHLDHCRSEGGTILDVGCGWGSLLARALEIGAASHCIGLTPSRSQSDWIAERMSDLPIEILTQAWENVSFGDGIDAITSIGALEHFARPDLKSQERTELYRRFFLRCRRSLEPGRPMSLQFISWAETAGERENKYLPRSFFPESALPMSSEIKSALIGLFELVEHEDRPSDYTQTLAVWIARMTDRRSVLIERHGKELFKAYSRSFRRFVLGFEGGSLGLHRMMLVAI